MGARDMGLAAVSASGVRVSQIDDTPPFTLGRTGLL